jgi:hypothetical protein
VVHPRDVEAVSHSLERYALLLLHSPGCKIVDSSANLGAGSFPGRQVVRPPTPGIHAHDLALVPVWVGRAAGQAPIRKRQEINRCNLLLYDDFLER